MTTKIFMLTELELQNIRAVMNRLYSERTMNADDMRDYAQKLQFVVDHVEPIESYETL